MFANENYRNLDTFAEIMAKTIVEGYVEGRRRCEMPRKQCTKVTISQCVRDCSRRKEIIGQVMVANDQTWSAEKKKHVCVSACMCVCAVTHPVGSFSTTLMCVNVCVCAHVSACMYL